MANSIDTLAAKEEEDARRNRLTETIAVLAIGVLLGVAGISWRKGAAVVAMADVAAAVLLSILTLVHHCSGYKRHCKYIAVAAMYILYLYLFVSGAVGGTTYMWHYTFPFFAIFLVGANHGALATLLLFIPVFALVVNDAMTAGTGYYSTLFASRFIPSVSVALTFAYLFEKEREHFWQKTLMAYQQQEKIIAERTRQLIAKNEESNRIEEKLRQAQKMEAVGTMASGVAHDLNNILSGIVTYPELLRSGLPPGSPLDGPLQVIEQAGKRAAAVVGDLLTLARDAASVKELVDVNLLVAEIMQSPEWLTFCQHHPGVRTKKMTMANEAVILGSQVHIRKCLMNLLINGVEAAAPEGRVEILTVNRAGSTSISPDLPEGAKQLIIVIRDTGPGIADEHIDHIFEPFYTTKKMGRSGSGLGLSVVWNTIVEHRGTIGVENRRPGAQFTVTLPVARQLAGITLPAEPFEWSGYRGQELLLVVDDEPQLIEIATRILQDLGYRVLAAASGEEAVAIQAKHPIDLVLLDMVLGDGIGGYETYRQMIANRPGQRAIIVSGYSTSEEVTRTLGLGASFLLKKPYSMTELARAVQQALAVKGGTSTA